MVLVNFVLKILYRTHMHGFKGCSFNGYWMFFSFSEMVDMNIEQTSQAQQLRQELLRQEKQDPRASWIPVARHIMWELLERFPLSMGSRKEISKDLDWEQCTGLFLPVPTLHSYIVDPIVALAWKDYIGDEYGCRFRIPVERESHVADEALLLSFSPRNLLTHIDGGG